MACSLSVHRNPIYWLTCYGLAIGTFEYSNCIMYIQDFVTFYDFCLLICIVPLLIAMATLVQFAHFVSLIRSRLQLLADLLKGHKSPALEQQWWSIKFNYHARTAAEDEDGRSKKLDMRVIEELYAKLHLALRLLDSVFGIQLIVMLTTMFITLTTLSYFTCMQAIRYNLSEGTPLRWDE